MHYFLSGYVSIISLFLATKIFFIWDRKEVLQLEEEHIWNTVILPKYLAFKVLWEWDEMLWSANLTEGAQLAVTGEISSGNGGKLTETFSHQILILSSDTWLSEFSFWFCNKAQKSFRILVLNHILNGK